MKKIVTISSLVFGTILLAGCGQQPVSQTQPTAPAPISQQPAPKTSQQTSQQNNNLIETAPAGWQIYKNDKYGFSMIYPSAWTLENNYKWASEKGDVGIVGMDNEFITLTSPIGNYVNIGVSKKGTSSDTGDVSTGRGLDKFVTIGNVTIGGQSSQFSFMTGQNGTVSSGTMKPIVIGDYEIHAFFLFSKDQKQNLTVKDQDFQTAIKSIESIKLPKN